MAARPQKLDLVKLVRARDYRRFLAIQVAAPATRPALYAITAFACEMTAIPTKVREPLAGFMRYAWWREALEEWQRGEPVRQHPVLEAVAALNPVPYAALFALITAGQEMLEELDKPNGMDAALNAAWASQLGNDARPLAALAQLPPRPGVRAIARLLWLSVRPR